MLALALLVAACAGTGGGPSDEQRVGKRAQERWDLVLAGDLAAAYGFLSPAQRSATSSLDYQRSVLQSRIRWKEARLDSAECGLETCEVRVSLDMTIVSPVPGVTAYDIEQIVTEQWVKAENEWWFVPQ
jgi:hypothetical protein